MLSEPAKRLSGLSVGLMAGPSNRWPPQTGGCGQGVQGGCATYHNGLKTGCVPGLWGGGGGLQHILRHQPGGGGHQRGQWETLRGGGGDDGTNTLAASPGGGYDGTNTLAAFVSLGSHLA